MRGAWRGNGVGPLQPRGPKLATTYTRAPATRRHSNTLCQRARDNFDLPLYTYEYLLQLRYQNITHVIIMKLLVVLGIVTLSAAMIPRESQVMNYDEMDASRRSDSASNTKPICDHHTPCGWSIYNKVTKNIEENLTNTFCDCKEGTSCVVTEDKISNNCYVYHCRTPEEEDLEDSIS